MPAMVLFDVAAARRAKAALPRLIGQQVQDVLGKCSGIFSNEQVFPS